MGGGGYVAVAQVLVADNLGHGQALGHFADAERLPVAEDFGNAGRARGGLGEAGRGAADAAPRPDPGQPGVGRPRGRPRSNPASEASRLYIRPWAAGWRWHRGGKRARRAAPGRPPPGAGGVASARGGRACSGTRCGRGSAGRAGARARGGRRRGRRLLPGGWFRGRPGAGLRAGGRGSGCGGSRGRSRGSGGRGRSTGNWWRRQGLLYFDW